MNAEVDATIGPILQVYARKHGVILSACDGDEPGLQMNLVPLGPGPRPDPARDRQRQGPAGSRTATRRRSRPGPSGGSRTPAMVTSFADGSKISFEQSIVANATGFKVLQRGMSRGLESTTARSWTSPSCTTSTQLRELGGVVDYTVGPAGREGRSCWPSTPTRSSGTTSNLYKMGEGPLYPFWVPYHLVHFETPNAIARVVLFGDNLAPPLGGPVVEVCAVAKRDLKAGEVLDEYGMYMTYGEACNVDEMSAGRYLPEGLVEGLPAEARHRQGRGAHLRRRRAARRAPRRPAARRAVPPLPRRDLARGAPARTRATRSRRRDRHSGPKGSDPLVHCGDAQTAPQRRHRRGAQGRRDLGNARRSR